MNCCRWGYSSDRSDKNSKIAEVIPGQRKSRRPVGFLRSLLRVRTLVAAILTAHVDDLLHLIETSQGDGIEFSVERLQAVAETVLSLQGTVRCRCRSPRLNATDDCHRLFQFLLLVAKPIEPSLRTMLALQLVRHD